MLEALNNLPKDKLEEIKLYLESEAQGKENKIRLDVIERLISKGSITKEAIEEIKKEANVSYPTNILQSWKSYYSLFFVCFYCGVCLDTKKEMKEFSEKINDDLKLTEISVTKIVDFNGATNLGADSAWVAIYNKKQPSHSFSLQLRITFSYPYISYGLYEHHSADQFLTKQEVTIDKFSYTEMLEF